MEELEERKAILAGYAQDIDQLQNELQAAPGLTKENTLVRGRLDHFKRGQSQAIASLARDYQITSEQITAHQAVLEGRAQELIEQRARLPALEELREHQVQIRNRYQDLYQAHPELFVRQTSPPLAGKKPGLSPTEKRIRVEAATELARITQHEKKQALKKYHEVDRSQGF